MATVELAWAGYEFGVDYGEGYVTACESEEDARRMASDMQAMKHPAKVKFRTHYTDGWGDVL